jgi:hypothetical protein
MNAKYEPKDKEAGERLFLDDSYSISQRRQGQVRI